MEHDIDLLEEDVFRPTQCFYNTWRTQVKLPDMGLTLLLFCSVYPEYVETYLKLYLKSF